MSVVNEESFTTVAMDAHMEEEKKDGDFDPALFLEKENDERQVAVESDEFEPTALWKKLWDSMNPAVCLSPTMACTHVFMDDDIVEYNRIVPPILRDMKHPGKQRTAALQRLYRFTDRDRHKNR